MRLNVECEECRAVRERRSSMAVVDEGGVSRPRDVNRHVTRLELGELLHDRVTLTCAEGHESIVRLRVPQHQVLFELALHAHADGYHRESVTGAAVALERFKEWSVRMLLASRGVEHDLIEKWWGAVGRRSEAQDGSFLAAWILAIGRLPGADADGGRLDRRMIEQRNACVHRGEIPSARQSLEYLEWAMRQMVKGEIEVRNTCDDLFDFEHLETDLNLVARDAGFVLMLEQNAIGEWRGAEERFVVQRNNDAEDDALEHKQGTFEPPAHPAKCPDSIVEGAHVPMAEVLKRAALRRRIGTAEFPRE
jgi:hypothetical protein